LWEWINIIHGVTRNKNLLIFTSSFPFGDGEQFLETEMPYIANKFKKVTVVPYSINGPRRCTPQHIRIELSLAYQNMEIEKNIFNIICCRIAAVEHAVFYKELMNVPRTLIAPCAVLKALSYLDNAIRVKKWIKYYIANKDLSLDETLFYTYWFGPQSMGLLLAKSEYPEIKVVSRAHGADLYEYVHTPPYIPFRQINLELIDKLLTISSNGKKYLLDHYKIPDHKVAVSRLGVDDPGFDTAYSKDGMLRIVSCSFLVPVKRISLLIKGICELADKRPDLPIEWSHLGDGPLRSKLEAEAEKILPSSVKYYFHGSLPMGGVIEYYRDNPVDIFINVSESEGIPVSIMEAQSCNIPVIATAVGGTPEIVNNENGLLLNKDPTPIEIADALAKFSPDQDLLVKRKNSKFNWYSKYNAKTNYGKFCDDLSAL